MNRRINPKDQKNLQKENRIIRFLEVPVTPINPHHAGNFLRSWEINCELTLHAGDFSRSWELIVKVKMLI
jgi:hypothetical protein